MPITSSLSVSSTNSVPVLGTAGVTRFTSDEIDITRNGNLGVIVQGDSSQQIAITSILFRLTKSELSISTLSSATIVIEDEDNNLVDSLTFRFSGNLFQRSQYESFNLTDDRISMIPINGSASLLVNPNQQAQAKKMSIIVETFAILV